MTIRRVNAATGEVETLQSNAPSYDTISDKRATAELTREAFLLACVAGGIITEQEAEEAADGSWPASFNTFLSGMTAAQRIEAKALWSRRDTVRRNSDLLALVAAEKSVSASALDAMFGIS